MIKAVSFRTLFRKQTAGVLYFPGLTVLFGKRGDRMQLNNYWCQIFVPAAVWLRSYVLSFH